MAKKTLWPYGLTVAILLYLGWLIFFVVFSGTQKKDFAEENYYQKGIKYQQVIDRIKRVRQLPGKVNIFYTAQKKIIIRLPIAAEDGTIQLYRPSDASLDRNFALQLNEEHQQVLDAADLPKGKWLVKIDWQSAGKKYYFEQPLIIE